MALQRHSFSLVFAGVLTFATMNSAVAEEPIRIVSPVKQAQLIELFTSEGCSSCPPADRWLSSLKDDSRLWREFVPVAFHVDYWNYLGWPDRFSSSAYSERQRQYAAAGGLRTIYTPGFVVNGTEWRGWFRGRMLDTNNEPTGTLRAEGDSSTLKVYFDPVNAREGDFQVHVARLGFDLHTDVRAGENSGSRLEHDFVVLGYAEQALKRDGAIHTTKIHVPKALEPAVHQGVALWVTRKGDLKPLQAAGGWFEQ